MNKSRYLVSINLHRQIGISKHAVFIDEVGVPFFDVDRTGFSYLFDTIHITKLQYQMRFRKLNFHLFINFTLTGISTFTVGKSKFYVELMKVSDTGKLKFLLFWFLISLRFLKYEYIFYI